MFVIDGSMKLIFVVLSAAIFSATGLSASSSGRITGGGTASPGQFPYVVSITENDRHICGGFIYSSRWIVTAASCVDGKSYTKLNVVAGQVSLINPDINEQKMDVYTITIFPQYNSTNKLNDVALLWLTADILFDNENVDFIPYGTELQDLAQPRKGIFMGWGASFDGGTESVNLRYATAVDNPMTAETPCGAYSNTEFDYLTMMCTGVFVDAPSGSPCQYDEGSPLVQEIPDPNDASLPKTATAVGIFSKTESCAISSGKSVFTRLSVYYSWFKDTAGLQPTRP
ncbi:hypothetical protein DAPPUDRAFT_309193 [Daphnia pulex]|uniref:Peptidase S1 domain-containing protein n=1 Tax=Daphnia pulex TaxID=6669 RepID=E9HAS6_DAPPU|nr:hypothetical protein DAPPUDRAFT_309193 [Daphnia pulex]|eukprot:EFX71080.1 hypothetical protein DAPPUDRAFT_309193 [Daphnia pulex]